MAPEHCVIRLHSRENPEPSLSSGIVNQRKPVALGVSLPGTGPILNGAAGGEGWLWRPRRRRQGEGRAGSLRSPLALCPLGHLLNRLTLRGAPFVPCESNPDLGLLRQGLVLGGGCEARFAFPSPWGRCGH